jgi:methyl-accepting chemotaxis protein
MKSLFKPSMILMGKMKYPIKFGLIFTVVLIPLVLLSYNMIHLITEEITFLESEKLGVKYVQAARLPMQYIQQHRGMTAAYVNGATEFKSRIISKRQDVDKYLAQLQKLENELGDTLKLTGTTNQLIQQWQSIKANSMNQQANIAIQNHSKLIAMILKLIVTVSDNSGITLDPKLDTYYMGSALVNILPNLMENMGQARAVGSSIAAKGEFTQNTFVRLSILVNNINTYANQLKSSMASAVGANNGIRQNLGSMIEGNNKAVEEMKNLLVKDLLEPEKITIASNKVFNTATHAINGSYKLFDAMAPELLKIFDKRIEKGTNKKIIEISIVTIVLILVFYLFVGLYLSIINNLGRVEKATKKIADGDLTARLEIKGNDEMQLIATDFNSMAEKFEALVQQIVSATSQLAAASEEVAVISKESATNLNKQRSEIEQVATAMNEMSATVQEVARSAGDAAGAAANADNEAKAGNSIVGQASNSIDALAREVENAAEVIQQLASDSESIGSVLDVIKGIAEQTNLLALNAAIEAARAGEQGRGFAVVADEVRTLAGRTQESTQEIESMIDKLQSGAKNAVTAMEAGQEKATIGVDQTKQAGEALAAIIRAVTTINEMNTHIASAAEQQTATTEEMNKNIININRLADETATSAEQSTTASGELSNLASNLQNLVSQFKIG